jgi:hypothetical protein
MTHVVANGFEWELGIDQSLDTRRLVSGLMCRLAMDNSVGCHTTQASTEDVPQSVDWKMWYASPSERRPPSRLERGNRLVW